MRYNLLQHHWNWTDFFTQDAQPPFVLDAAQPKDCDALLKLSFVQGLQVIVTSVPRFAHDEWQRLRAMLHEHSGHEHVDYWLLVAQLLRDYLHDVHLLLNTHIEQALAQMLRWLNAAEDVERFALLACLRHYAQSSVQAEMLLRYLLQNADTPEQQLQIVLAFYKDLTPRQQDVALLAAYGLTNPEIAAELSIEPVVVAEHMSHIFTKFTQALHLTPDRYGNRYRLIHWLTRLFSAHPYLLSERKR